MYFIDVQGTLISDTDKQPIKGACETLAYLNEHSIEYKIVTNNTKKSSIEFIDYLNSIGLNFSADDYLDPLMLLQDNLKANKIAAYGDDAFLSVLQTMGYKLDYEKPEYVLVGVKKDYSSEDFASIIEFILNGAKLLGMHSTTLYAKDGKRYPGVGAILTMLHSATSADYSVVGKPSELFYEQARTMCRTPIEFKNLTMISDDLKGDLVGAKELGMTTIFVLSGKYKSKEEILPFISKRQHPDYIFDDMSDVLEHIKGSR